MQKDKRVLIKEFDPKFIELARKHMEEGWSYQSFTGKYPIRPDVWSKWTRENPELLELRTKYNKNKIGRRYSYKITKEV